MTSTILSEATSLAQIERAMIGAAMCGDDESLERLIARRAELAAQGVTR